VVTTGRAPEYDLTVVLDDLARTFGERWAGAWIRHEPTVDVSVGVVAPQADDVLRVHRAMAAIGWSGSTVACRYSEAELERVQDRLDRVLMAAADSGWVSTERDPEKNLLRVVLATQDRALIEAILEEMPADAIEVSIQPGMSYQPLA